MYLIRTSGKNKTKWLHGAGPKADYDQYLTKNTEYRIPCFSYLTSGIHNHFAHLKKQMRENSILNHGLKVT